MKNDAFKVYCDMDGVLVDCEQQHINYFGLGWEESRKKFGHVESFNKIEKEGLKFWSTMKWLQDGKFLYDYLTENFKFVYILSNHGNYSKSKQGKIEWLNREIGAWSGDFRKDKFIYATSNAILIDDYYNGNIIPWINNSGIGIHHISAYKTIEKLNLLKR